MQKKTMYLVIGIVVVAILAIGGYALMHNSSSDKNNTTATTPSNSTQPSTSDTTTTTAVIQTKTASNVGSYLADASGNALYTYNADTNGVSNCNGSCLYAWPAYAPTSTSATLPANVTIITRSDNTKQYAYKGKPLYTFTSDSVGNVTGNGVNGFSVAKP